MTGIPSYSTTAASNVQSNTGIDWDEGMSPAAVNNSARQNMADTRTAFNDLIWFQYGKGDGSYSPVYVSGTQFKLTAIDVTTTYHVGRRVKVTGSTTGTIYGVISASAYSTDTTVTVVWDSGSLSNESLSVYLSQVPVTGAPVGIDAIGMGATKSWTPVDSSGDGLSLTVDTAGYNVLGNLVYVWGRITFPTNSSTQQVKIGGLPYTALSGTIGLGGGFGVHGASDDFGRVVPNTDTFVVSTVTTTNRLNSNYSGLTIFFQFWYPRA